jgi:hypothetical protein
MGALALTAAHRTSFKATPTVLKYFPCAPTRAIFIIGTVILAIIVAVLYATLV